MNKYKKELLDLKAFIYNSIPGRTVEDVNKSAFDLVKMLADKSTQMEKALHKIAVWQKAYPLDVFPEPDMKRAHEVLSAAGMTLDAISASNMRHVLKGIEEIVREGLEGL